MATSSSISALPHVYRMSPVRQAILDGTAVCLFAVPAGIMIASPQTAGAAIILFLVLSPTFLFLLFSAWYPRLTVSADGVRLRNAIGYSSFFVPWSNVERVWLSPGKEGLILRAPLETRAARNFKNWSGYSYAGTRFYDDEQRQYIEEQRYAPLQMWAFWLRHGTLADELAAHIPSLADGLDAKRAEYHREQSKANHKLLWVFAISAVICGATMIYAIWSRGQPPAVRANLKEGENALGLFAGRAFAFALSVYALINLRAAYSFWRRKHPGYAALWLLYAVVQILLVNGILIG